jgi:hypothetical protein
VVAVVVVLVIAEAEQGRCKMKNLIYKTIIVSFILLGLQGCYTILWTPDTKITEEYETTSYYYGYASDFYDIPWWVNVPIIVGYPSYYPPDGNQAITKDRNNSLENDSRNIRNNDGGRTTDGGNPEIINTPPPTVSAPNPPSSGSESNNNTGSTVRTESSNSGNTRSSDTRSNTGNRNSNSGRR